MVERQLLHLSCSGINEALLVETHRHTPQAGHAFYIFFAGRIINMDALTSFNDVGADLAVLDGVGIGMQDVSDVALLQRARCGAHKRTSLIQDVDALYPEQDMSG